MSRGCPVDVPWMSRGCPVDLKYCESVKTRLHLSAMPFWIKALVGYLESSQVPKREQRPSPRTHESGKKANVQPFGSKKRAINVFLFIKVPIRVPTILAKIPTTCGSNDTCHSKITHNVILLLCYHFIPLYSWRLRWLGKSFYGDHRCIAILPKKTVIIVHCSFEFPTVTFQTSDVLCKIV